MTPGSDLMVVRSEPLCAESSLELQQDGLTPLSAFYVRNNFPVPSPATRLTVGGAVKRPRSLGSQNLGRLPRRRLAATLEGAGNGRAPRHRPRLHDPAGAWGAVAAGRGQYRGMGRRPPGGRSRPGRDWD